MQTLYVRGSAIALAPHTVMSYVSDDIVPEQTVKVIVQDISFVIAKSALVAPAATTSPIPLANNYFELALRHNTTGDIVIHSTADDKLGQAKYYPAVFDYLRRRWANRNELEPIADYHMAPADARELHELFNVLFQMDADAMLPTTADGLKLWLALLPDVTEDSKHEHCAELCTDPLFVRLVQELQSPQMPTTLVAQKRRRQTLRLLRVKHSITKMPMAAVKASRLVKVDRGTRFIVFVNDDYESLGLPRRDFIELQEESSRYIHGF